MNLLHLASRNIFRNTRRTLLTILVIAIGILCSVTGMSYFNGVTRTFTEESIKYTGSIRITGKNYAIAEKTMDVSCNILLSDIRSIVSQTIKNVARIRFAAYIYKSEEQDKQAAGYGIEPDDLNILGLDNSVFEGNAELNSDSSILIGRRLADTLKLKPGDEITLLTKTQYDSMWAQNYTVSGIFDLQHALLNQGFFISLTSAQYLLDMEDSATELLLFTDNDSVKETTDTLRPQLSDVLITPYYDLDMNKQISQTLPVVEKIIIMVFAILAGIGIVNTMIMVVFERKSEIGILKALGMKKAEIRKLFLIEGLIIGTAGSILGIIFGGIIAWYLSVHGINLGAAIEKIDIKIPVRSIIYPELSPVILVKALLAGILTALLASLIPVIPASSQNPADCLKE